jgi:hypothetical protein
MSTRAKSLASLVLSVVAFRRWRRAATLKHAGRAGADRKAFAGRIGRKALRRDTCRLVDAPGNGTTAMPRSFQIVNP